MRPLRDVLTNAEQSGAAVGVSTSPSFAALKGVVAAAAELNLPVVVGVSESEREFIGVHQIAVLIGSIREESDLSLSQ